MSDNRYSTDKIYDWRFISQGGKNIAEKLLTEWGEMLNNKSLTENDYQLFIAQHAGLFLDPYSKSLQNISKLSLGGDFETDFVAIHEGYSDGVFYEFIELETPHEQAYIKKGQPSSRLMSAIQQISNWRDWMTANRRLFSDLFPNRNNRDIKNSNLLFTIIIGRRTEDEELNYKRNTLSDDFKVKIRSYDYLTENIKSKISRIHSSPMIFSSEMDNLSDLIRNHLANPFYSAISDGEWKRFRKEIKSNHHFFAHNYEAIFKYRKYSKMLYEFIEQYNMQK